MFSSNFNIFCDIRIFLGYFEWIIVGKSNIYILSFLFYFEFDFYEFFVLIDRYLELGN